MFLEFYKLQEHPFRETPDPRFVYLSATHREALASLFYGLETGCGFLALIAEPGMGKTTLLFHVLEHLRSAARTAFLFQTQCDSRELVRSLLADLGIDTGKKDLAGMHDQLRRVLINEASAGRRLVVFIDETQNLTESALETVRLLSDFETPASKLMQIVLAGQPQLADKLASPALAQLRQRVSILCRLDRFSPAETDAYINHRLRVAGYKGGQLFTPEALATIAAQSKGIPRTINMLCFNALSLGYALGKKGIDSSLVREAARDLEVGLLGSERSLIGQQAPMMPGASVLAPQAAQAASSSAVVVNRAKRDSKAFQAELRGASRFWPLPSALNSTTAIPEPARPATVTRTEIQESTDVAESEAVVFDLEASVTTPVPGSTVVPRGIARLEHICRTALTSKNDKLKLARWSAVVALAGLITLVSLSFRESVAHQRVESVSPLATVNAEEKSGPSVVSASSAEPRKSKPKILSSTLRARSNPGSAPLDESLSKEATSAPSSVPIDPNVPSDSIVAIVPSSPTGASPAPKSQQPEQDRLLEPSYLLYQVEPAYPRDAEEQGVEGTVRMRNLVGKDGRVRKVELLTGPALLVSAAISAARQWRYIPAILNGQPVESEEEISIDFRLPRGSPRRAAP